MTTPSDPTVLRNVQQAPTTTPVPDEAVVATAKKLVRVRTFTKTTFERVGVPALIGAATGLAVTRAARRSQDSDTETDDVSDSNE